jgi:peptidoglycan hydrolase-like protein with peptidoglycan-binding domain
VLDACLAAERAAGLPRGALLAVAAHEGTSVVDWLRERIAGGTLLEAAREAATRHDEDVLARLPSIQRWLDGSEATRRRQLEAGMSGEDVTELKRLLREWYARSGRRLPRRMRGPVYGTAAVEAVKEFQRVHGLEADGVVGPETWSALARQSAA